MIFVDYLGLAERFTRVRGSVADAIGAVMRLPSADVVVRRLVVDDPRDSVELWVELSSDEQLYRYGRPLAKALYQAVQSQDAAVDVWVMFRIVPLDQAFLNGVPRARGGPALE